MNNLGVQTRGQARRRLVTENNLPEIKPELFVEKKRSSLSEGDHCEKGEADIKVEMDAEAAALQFQQMQANFAVETR